MSEFPDKAGAPDPGDPALDPPMTVRVERWEDRMRTDVRRAVRVDTAAEYCWLVSAPAREVGAWLTAAEVRTWPVCPAVVNEAAYHLAAGRGPREGAVQDVERGDMDVDAFRPRSER